MPYGEDEIFCRDEILCLSSAKMDYNFVYLHFISYRA